MQKGKILEIANLINRLFHKGTINSQTRAVLANLAKENKWSEFKNLIQSFRITGDCEITKMLEVLQNVK